jgi:hypothetical protein
LYLFVQVRKHANAASSVAVVCSLAHLFIVVPLIGKLRFRASAASAAAPGGLSSIGGTQVGNKSACGCSIFNKNPTPAELNIIFAVSVPSHYKTQLF